MRTERRRSTRISRENRVKDHSATKRATDRRLFCTRRQTHCFLVLLWCLALVHRYRSDIRSVGNRRGSLEKYPGQMHSRFSSTIMKRDRSVGWLKKKKMGQKRCVVSLTDTRTCPARRPPLNWFLAPLFSKQKQLSYTTSYRGRGGGSSIRSSRTMHAALRMRVPVVVTWLRALCQQESEKRRAASCALAILYR